MDDLAMQACVWGKQGQGRKQGRRGRNWLASFFSVSVGTPEVAIRHKVNKTTRENRNNCGTTKEFTEKYSTGSLFISFTTHFLSTQSHSEMTFKKKIIKKIYDQRPRKLKNEWASRNQSRECGKKAKEYERRWEAQYLLEKDTHKHRQGDGESRRPHSGQNNTRFAFRKPQLFKSDFGG